MNSKFLMELYNQQAKMIYFYLRKNGCGHEDAEDIVQESYLKYISYSSGVDSNKALSYILGIVVYGTKDELMPIINKPFVSAVSVGGIIDNY